MPFPVSVCHKGVIHGSHPYGIKTLLNAPIREHPRRTSSNENEQVWSRVRGLTWQEGGVKEEVELVQ